MNSREIAEQASALLTNEGISRILSARGWAQDTKLNINDLARAFWTEGAVAMGHSNEMDAGLTAAVDVLQRHIDATDLTMKKGILIGILNEISALKSAPMEIEPQAVANDLCERKTADIIKRDGYKLSGYVLKADDAAARVCVSVEGAVAWFTPQQWHWLIFNRDHVEFAWPKPIGHVATEIEPTVPVSVLRTKLAEAALGRGSYHQNYDGNLLGHAIKELLRSAGAEKSILSIGEAL